MIMEIGKPKKNIELIRPNCEAVSPNSVPNWGRIPALMLKEKAVVIMARQLAMNSLLAVNCLSHETKRV
jgi:hypothetical protein